MSYNITTAFIQQYNTNVAMLLQQQVSRLRSAVQVSKFEGQAAELMEQFGSVNPVRNLARHADTPIISTPQDRRWVFPQDYFWADLLDKVDMLRLKIDPTDPYCQAGAAAMARAIDDEIISGMLGSNITGQLSNSVSTGTLFSYNSNSQSVPMLTGGSSGNVGLNVAKLRQAKKILLQADVDIDNDTLFVAISAQQHDNLLNEAQAISLDYNSQPVLVNGKISSFMGFNFIHTERIPGAANFNSTINNLITSGDTDGSYVTGSRWICPFWAKSGVALGMWNEVQTAITDRSDKNNSKQILVTGTFGATRLEEKRCGIINCK